MEKEHKEHFIPCIETDLLCTQLQCGTPLHVRLSPQVTQTEPPRLILHLHIPILSSNLYSRLSIRLPVPSPLSINIHLIPGCPTEIIPFTLPIRSNPSDLLSQPLKFL